MKFGPGKFTIGKTGDEIDASCAVNSLRITVDKNEDDGKTMLCGTQKPGRVTYTYALSGNVDTDSELSDGLFALAAANPGSVHPFTYSPNNAGTSASGNLVVDPLEFGGDEYGEDMNSDLEFTLVGPPIYKFKDDVAPVIETAGPLIINGKARAGAEQPADPAATDPGPAADAAPADLTPAP